MKIPRFSVRNPVTTMMMMCLVLILGFVSFTGLRLDLMPNINPPVLAVMTTYQGAGPEEVAEIVTKPLEEVVGTSSGLESIKSRSSANSSLIIARYKWGTDISEVRADLTASVGMIQFPDGVDAPMLVKFDPSMMPIIQLAISNGEDTAHLQELVNEVIVTQLQTISGVASVSVTGGYDKEIIVSLDEALLQKHQLTQSHIVQIIQGNNLTYPGGAIIEGDEKLNLRIVANIDSIEELKELPIRIIKNGEELDILLLGDIAEVSLGVKEVSSVARTNGTESLLISIQKEASANTVAVSNEVQNRLETIKNEYSNLQFYVASDQGEIIEKSLENVMLALVLGGIFAIAVIMVFLRSIKSTVIVGISIPFSVIATFVLMYFSGITLNIMSLGGLALGVGMLVDNAIVVIENIYRHISHSKSSKKAAVMGAQEVSGAVTASMLTTISVFIPIVFIGGMVGDLFKELALTVTFSLLASWLVALTVVPTLASFLLTPGKVKVHKDNQFYKTVISWALNHRIATLVITGTVFAFSLSLIPQVGTELLPSQDEGIFIVDVELSEGATLATTLEVIKEIENELFMVTEVDLVNSSVGSGDGMRATATGSKENTGSITVKLIPSSERTLSTERIMNKFEDDLKIVNKDANITFSLSSSMEAMTGHSNEIEILLLGNDSKQLKVYSKELTKRLVEESVFRTVIDNAQEGKPEYQYIVDNKLAMEYGLTSYQVGSFIMESLQGKVATTILDTTVRVTMEDVTNSKEDIEKLTIMTQSGESVALSGIGEVVRGTGPVSIVRDNQQESFMVTAVFEGQDMGTVSKLVQTSIDEMIEDLSINTDQYEIKVAGGAEMMDEAFRSLLLAVFLAILFVYMVMASQFGSFLQPFIIMFTLPLAVIGVVLGLFISDQAFGITAFLGIIILVGIVLNNAIVYIDYANQLRAQGLAIRDSLIQAGLTRLRPIIMTALTTILGLVPLAIGAGEGAEIQAPMAVAVIGGLLSSTVLTLVVIPVLYSILTTNRGEEKAVDS